jgi:hypothetical protein
MVFRAKEDDSVLVAQPAREDATARDDPLETCGEVPQEVERMTEKRAPLTAGGRGRQTRRQTFDGSLGGQ